MTTTLAYTGKLIVTACWCGIRHAVPSDLYEYQARQHANGQKVTSIYCPLGHGWIPSGESELDRTKRELMWERDALTSIRADRDQIEASRRAIKGQVTKLKKRIIAGACPFGCRRHFTDLERHVATKHPGQPLEAEAVE